MAKAHEIYLGARFGKLTVTGERIPTRQATVPVRCDCGTEKVAYVHHLGVQVTSCGCARPKATPTFHGKSKTAEYRTWVRMIQRCTNPKNSSWGDYGGRGISVHPDFRNDFAAFLREVGPKPTPKHSIDRIDVDRGYEPGNIRWATNSEQQSNKRRKSDCKRGHPLHGENLAIRPNGTRACRACWRLAAARARARAKADQS